MEENRLEAAVNFKFFCETYAEEALGLEWSPAHLEVIEKIMGRPDIARAEREIARVKKLKKSSE